MFSFIHDGGGGIAYTFRFLGGTMQSEELHRAEYYAKKWGLPLRYVDIGWEDVERYLPIVMEAKCAPVHSIEPQIYKAAIQAKQDGVTRMIVGESADLAFGGMDGLLSKDWTYAEFQRRYTFTDPHAVLSNPVDMDYLFARYRVGENGIDFLAFMDQVFSVESSGSYQNAFAAAGMPYTDPYARLKMKEPLDLHRVRSGEPKYLIRALFRSKYPEREVPDKIPMPRPVDAYFKDWTGPKHGDFRRDLDLGRFTGNQKWQMYCLEQFLNRYC